jgi:hypothetical protein
MVMAMEIPMLMAETAKFCFAVAELRPQPPEARAMDECLEPEAARQTPLDGST